MVVLYEVEFEFRNRVDVPIQPRRGVVSEFQDPTHFLLFGVHGAVVVVRPGPSMVVALSVWCGG